MGLFSTRVGALLWVMSLSFGVAEAQTAAEAWRRAGLELSDFVGERAEDGQFASFNEKCRASLKQFEGCVDGLSAALEVGSPARVLVGHDFHEVALGQADGDRLVVGAFDATLPPIFKGATLSERGLASLAFNQARRSAIRKIYDDARTAGRVIDFTMVIELVAKGVESGTEGQASLATGLALDAAIKRWQDPHSFLMPKVTFAASERSTETYAGVGVTMELVDEGAEVEQPHPNGPAERAGVWPGDLIVAIDGQSIKGAKLQEVSDLIRGKPGTTVRLTIRRAGAEQTLAMTRESIVSRNVSARLLEGERPIGYIKVASFRPPNTADEFIDAVNEFEEKDVAALVVDLRGNGGGNMGNMFLMAEPFLNQWEDVYTTRDIRDGHVGYSATSNARTFMYASMPLFVLVDQFSASASEVFAGLMQAHRRAYVVGSRTRGKGTGQEPNERKYRFANTIYYETTKMFFLPGGSTTQVHGVEPDFAVFAKPGASHPERFVFRESDFDNAIEPLGPAQKRPGPDVSDRIATCALSNGELARRYEVETARGKFVDYPLSFTKEAIRCAIEQDAVRVPW